jgi:hypothetical protein
MWQFILIGDMVAMGFMISLIMWMSLKQSKEAQDYCMNIPLFDTETTQKETIEATRTKQINRIEHERHKK